MTADDAEFAALARQIAQTSGFAVGAYKDKCIRRRIAVRMRPHASCLRYKIPARIDSG